MRRNSRKEAYGARVLPPRRRPPRRARRRKPRARFRAPLTGLHAAVEEPAIAAPDRCRCRRRRRARRDPL